MSNQLERAELIDFQRTLRSSGLADRTIFNRFEMLTTFLRGIGVSGLVARKDWPRYTEKIVAAYTETDLKSLLDACDWEEALLWRFFLCTGMREQEVAYCSWPDVDLDSCIAYVKTKARDGFRPKDYQERAVPLPKALADDLRHWRSLNLKARMDISKRQW